MLALKIRIRNPLLLLLRNSRQNTEASLSLFVSISYSELNSLLFSQFGQVGRVLANSLGDRRLIQVESCLKMVFDASLFNTQHFKVRIKVKVEKSREWSLDLCVVAVEKGTFVSPSTRFANFTYFYFSIAADDYTMFTTTRQKF